MMSLCQQGIHGMIVKKYRLVIVLIDKHQSKIIGHFKTYKTFFLISACQAKYARVFLGLV
jgi:hypothetical protein